MIQSFRCKETETVYRREISRRLPQSIRPTGMRKLWAVDAAITLDDLRIPLANHLEMLHGDRTGQHSIRINQQWRVCFRWENGHPYDVEIVDCH